MIEEALANELNLLRKLVEINTTVTSDSRTGYAECSEMIRLEAQRMGLGTEVLDGRDVTIDGDSRPNVVVSLEGTSDVNLIYVTHLDVVPADPEKWKTPPFQLRVTKDRAYGRGAADDKSNIVAAMSAMAELAQGEPEVNINLLVTVDEEIGGRAGIDYLFKDLKMRGHAGVVIDSAPNYVSIGASGALWGRVTIKGEGGHSGYPHKADNAIYRATRYIDKLREYHSKVSKVRSKIPAPPQAPYPKVHGRFTITMIHAGEKENVIPGDCEIRFDRRLTPEEDPTKAQAELQDYLTKVAKTQGTTIDDFQILHSINGYFTDAKHPFVQHFSTITNQVVGKQLPIVADLGGNDGAQLAEVDIPVVCYGTIRDDTNYHAPNEFVYLKDIQTVRDVLTTLGKSPASMFT
ncbi:MAG: M20/M25/M40 family metallo-hydrolase [Candidatus Hermodarchaeota archaeon]|nr:M20/M25/M40 family metallo-hydrolase [Candidatus Hermodarchaeota archaeon]